MKRKIYKITQKSFEELKANNQKELWQKAKEQGYDLLCKEVPVLFIKAEDGDDDKNSFTAVFSTNVKDRHWDVVEQNFDLKSFKKNPVYLDSHNYDSIEHIIGKIEKIKVKDEQLIGQIVFNTNNPKGEMARQMVIGGFLNTSSIGFIPLEFNDEGSITKSELLEISAVAVPANPEALIEKDIYGKEEDDDSDVEEEEEVVAEVVEEDKTVEEEAEPVIEEAKAIKPSVKDLVVKAVKDEVASREAILKQILSATKKLKEYKGRNPSYKREKALINKAVRELLKNKN